MNKSSVDLLFFLLLVIVIVISGCTSQPTASNNAIEPTRVIEVHRATITPTRLPPTRTFPHALVPTATYTPWPTQTNTPTLQATLTPGPTMTVTEVREFISSQLFVPINCRLPCWWSVSPGQTSWGELLPIFLNHGVVPQRYSNTYSVQWRVSEGDNATIRFGQTYVLGNSKSEIIEAIKVGSRMSNDQRLVYNDPSYYQFFSNYTLSSILSTLGKPEEVGVITTQVAREGGQIPFDLFIEYPSQGVSVNYEGIAKIIENQYELCPRQTFFHLYLWSPNKSDSTVVSKGKYDLFFPKEYIYRMKDLESAAGIDLDEFYEQFINYNRNKCLVTPINIW